MRVPAIHRRRTGPEGALPVEATSTECGNWTKRQVAQARRAAPHVTRLQLTECIFHNKIGQRAKDET